MKIWPFTNKKEGDAMLLSRLRNFFIGKPLATKNLIHERLTNLQGLAIFGSDALSSTAYATEEILLVLAVAGAATSFISIPIAIVIAALIVLVAVSYRQAIFAYPQGGGVYNVAKENLGETPALIGAASLVVDYILTAAVSVVAGVAAITSAVPALYPHRVLVGIIVIGLLTWANLRGVKESGKLFSVPTYIFILTMLGTVAYGFWKYFSGTLPTVNPVHATDTLSSLGMFLILRAFAAGCTAMTGIEAVSNGVQAFKAPESRNAARTIVRMAVVLGSVFLGLTFLAHWMHVVPIASGEETVISMIARALFGTTPLYFLVQAATSVILLLAANTPFAGFPRVASQLAKDGYFPRQFFNLGRRLVFANGIMFLSLFSAALVYLFDGSVHALIPLYAVGVFLGFSISQFGMIKHWQTAGAGNKKSIVINMIGCIATSVVLVVVFVSKFSHGAWVLVPAVIGFVLFMKSIKGHYTRVAYALSLNGGPVPDVFPEKTAVFLIADVNRATLYGMKFIRSLKPAHIQAFHVSMSTEDAEAFRKRWQGFFPDISLDIVVSEYRDLVGPILVYLKQVNERWKNDDLIVVMTEIVPDRIHHFFLHNQTAFRIRLAIEQDPDINAEIFAIPVKISEKI